MQRTWSLPPGQRAVEGFPRFGTHFHLPPPIVPADPAIEVRCAAGGSAIVPLAALAELPRREQLSDLHCVAGWSAVGLCWEGVAFADFHRAHGAPLVPPGAAISHVVFEGLDGYRSVALIDDALAGDVLIADRLDGRPLDGDHGAPVRLVSPGQYGFVSTKHLCRIELHDREPVEPYHPNRLLHVGLRLVRPHPRARVWHEERHRHLPARPLRPIYRSLIRPFAVLAARGGRRGR